MIRRPPRSTLFPYTTLFRSTFSFPMLAALMLEPDVFLRLYDVNDVGGAGAVVILLSIGNLFYTGTGPTGYVISMTDRKSTRLNSSHANISYAVFCLKKKTTF